jgi:hypothetical protein
MTNECRCVRLKSLEYSANFLWIYSIFIYLKRGNNLEKGTAIFRSTQTCIEQLKKHLYAFDVIFISDKEWYMPEVYTFVAGHCQNKVPIAIATLFDSCFSSNYLSWEQIQFHYRSEPCIYIYMEQANMNNIIMDTSYIT